MIKPGSVKKINTSKLAFKMVSSKIDLYVQCLSLKPDGEHWLFLGWM